MTLTLGPLAHLVLLGASPLFSDIHKHCARNKIPLSIITSPDQCQSLDTALQPIVAGELETEQVRDTFKRASAESTLSISFGARWIFSRQQISELFQERLLNVHGTRLPYDRGGGGFSWRIMKNDRLGNLLLHKVDPGVDTGPILLQQGYVIPKECRTPAQLFKDYTERLTPFVLGFLESITHEKVTFPLHHQGHEHSTYTPRLSSDINSWIDWSLNADEIERFITAFDDPYPGALCQWRNGICRIKKVQAHGGEPHCHPHQAGIIFRKSEDYVLCHTRCGRALVIEDIRAENGTSILANLQLGDRLFTSPEQLSMAHSSRVVFTPTGLKT